MPGYPDNEALRIVSFQLTKGDEVLAFNVRKGHIQIATAQIGKVPVIVELNPSDIVDLIRNLSRALALMEVV